MTCEYFETCSRRGAPDSCHNGDAASHHRCRKAEIKAGAFPGEPRFNRIDYPALKTGSSQFEPRYNVSGIDFELLLITSAEDLYYQGFKVTPSRNREDGTLAGYEITDSQGNRYFKPEIDF